MTRIAKLYAVILANPRAAISFREFERLVLAFGFSLDRQRRSHRAFAHPACPRPLTVQPRKDGGAKAYQVNQFLDMVRQAGLSIQE